MVSWLAKHYSSIIKLDRVTWLRRDYIERGAVYKIEPMPGFRKGSGREIALPKPMVPKGADASEILLARRSIRSFKNKPVELEVLSSLLHIAFGVTKWEEGIYGYDLYPLRAFPSAGALQPVEIYLSANNVAGLSQGIYRYIFINHSLDPLKLGDYSKTLSEIALDQDHVAEAPINIIITIFWARSAWKYGSRGYKYSLLDAGFAGENLYIASKILGLGTCAVGAFFEEELCELLGADCVSEIPVLIMPVGYPFEERCVF
ncbi:MAG TPA: SagB/ThcOx family dehydrogenase [Sulfolobales archaeon]|nr:SagB/ThcOx family dehydrogenase [Sulfolobales archaeon]